MCLASGVGIRVFYGAATGSGDGFSGRNEDQNELLNCRKLKYIHGGPTGMVVANMAVHGPFFQPANVEGTGSHHSWL